MARVQSFAIPDEEVDVMQAFKQIARREGKTASQLIWQLVKDYVSKHSENPVAPLDKWVEKPQLVLYPTLGDEPSEKKLAKFPADMLRELSRHALEYHNMSEWLLTWMERHEKDHKVLNYRHPHCPYCRGEG
jgi:DNA-binding transcriptional regulator GbsR (MarR family)